jgi:hypothetical protein
MLNLKKGLALVLAAATAFTFAPVANLGNSVDAQAAIAVDNPITNLTVPVDAYTTSGLDNTTSPKYDGFSKIIPLADGSGFWIEKAVIRASENDTYRLFSTSGNVTVFKHDDSTDTVDISTVNTNAALANTWVKIDKSSTAMKPAGSKTPTEINAVSGKLTVDLWISGPGTSSVTFEDKGTATQKDYQTTTLTINAPKYQGAGITGISIKNTTITDSADLTATASHAAEFKAAAETQKNNGEYVLSLNDNKYGYVLDASSITATEWNGITAASAAAVKPSDADAVLSINDVYAAGTASATAGKWQIIPTGHTSESKTLTITAKATNYLDVSQDIKYTVDRSNNSIDTLSFAPKYGKQLTVKSTDTTVNNGDTALVSLTKSGPSYTLDGLNAQVQNSGKLSVAAEAENVTYKSSNENVVTVDDKGNVKVVAAGNAAIYIFVPQTNSNKALVATVSVPVRSTAVDHLDYKTDVTTLGDEDKINLDTADQTATNAIKSVTVTPTSAGSLKTSMKQTSGSDAFGFNASTGLITSNRVTSTAVGYITITSESDSARKIAGTSVSIPVKVWTLPAADFDLDPITLETGDSQLLKATVRTPSPYDIKWNSVSGSELYYSLSNNEQLGINNDNNQTTSRITAKGQTGVTSVKATIFGTSKTRPTTKAGKVTVVAKGFKPAKEAAGLTVASKDVTLDVGKTASVAATGTSILAGTKATYASNNTAVATVSDDGTITAVAAGSTVVVVTLPETDKFEGATALVNVTVNPVKPAKVTGLKVANKKGAKVSVSWTSQGKNINYRVYKKVGNGKWVAKNVAGSKTTLSVKKGAKVQVKVKSYVKDENGKTTWGPAATKAKTFKTDKK